MPDWKPFESIVALKMQTPTHQVFCSLLVEWDKTARQGGEGDSQHWPNLIPISDHHSSILPNFDQNQTIGNNNSNWFWSINQAPCSFSYAGVASVLLLVGEKEAREVFAPGGASSPAGRPVIGSIIITTGSINHSFIKQSIIITTGWMSLLPVLGQSWKCWKWAGSRNWRPFLEEVEMRSPLRLLLATTSITNSLSLRWVVVV